MYQAGWYNLFIPRWNDACADARQRCTHVVVVDSKKKTVDHGLQTDVT